MSASKHVSVGLSFSASQADKPRSRVTRVKSPQRRTLSKVSGSRYGPDTLDMAESKGMMTRGVLVLTGIGLLLGPALASWVDFYCGIPVSFQERLEFGALVLLGFTPIVLLGAFIEGICRPVIGNAASDASWSSMYEMLTRTRSGVISSHKLPQKF